MTKLSEWADKIIKRDMKCVICGTKKELEAHHVFKVNNQDKIYYSINNGVAICHDCHMKYHENYGVDCSIKNLLDLKHKIGNKRIKNLKKENKRLKKIIKQIRKALGDEV